MHPYTLLGFFFVALAFAGAFLPLLPTVPFLLVAAACFSRSSPKWHQWLLQNKTFGPAIRDWDENRCMSKKAKVTAITSIILFGGMSVFVLIQNSVIKGIGSLLILYAIYFICRIRTCDKC